MPNLSLSEADAADLIDYMEARSKSLGSSSKTAGRTHNH